MKPSLKEMVHYVQTLTHLYGERWLEEYVTSSGSSRGACCCMGVREYSVCPCEMDISVYNHKVEILNLIDPELALWTMRRNIMRALK